MSSVSMKDFEISDEIFHPSGFNKMKSNGYLGHAIWTSLHVHHHLCFLLQSL